jgi:S-formylglutathione hydrolase FrmB
MSPGAFGRHIFGCVLVAALLCAALPSQTTSAPASRPRRERAAQAPREYAGSVDYASIESKLLGGPVKYGVYLPPGYKDPANANKRYPVVFYLHGLWESAERWVGRDGALLFDTAIKEKALRPVIVIVADAGFTFYSDTLDGKKPYAKFFIEEFVPWVDLTFRTTGKRSGRLIGGNSMGGFGALKFAFQHPELFSAVAVHSPAILPENPAEVSPRARRTMGFLKERGVLKALFGDPIDLEKWKAANPIALAETAKLDPPVAIYVDCGEDDDYEFDEGCRTLNAVLKKRNLKHEFAIRPGDHGWSYIRAAMPHALKFFETQLKLQP